jgi:molybdate transport system substrate-binding protein
MEAVQSRPVPAKKSHSRLPRIGVLATLLTLVLLAIACGGGGGGDDGNTQETSAPDRFSIWAPEGLKGPVEAVVQKFKKRNPDITVDEVYEGGPELNDRLLQGERPDMYVGSAREIETLADEGTLPADYVEFGEDTVVFLVPPGNPKNIASLDVFALDPTTTSALCDAATPCGRGGRAVLVNANITAAPDVTVPSPQVLIEQVSKGEVDAGLAYRTQAVRARQKDLVQYAPIPTTVQVDVPYRIAIVRPGEAVDAFATFVRNAEINQKILGQYGLAPLEGDPQ